MKDWLLREKQVPQWKILLILISITLSTVLFLSMAHQLYSGYDGCLADVKILYERCNLKGVIIDRLAVPFFVTFAKLRELQVGFLCCLCIFIVSIGMMKRE